MGRMRSKPRRSADKGAGTAAATAGPIGVPAAALTSRVFCGQSLWPRGMEHRTSGSCCGLCEPASPESWICRPVCRSSTGWPGLWRPDCSGCRRCRQSARPNALFHSRSLAGVRSRRLMPMAWPSSQPHEDRETRTKNSNRFQANSVAMTEKWENRNEQS